MSTFDRVKSAKDPQSALLAIAHSLDVIMGRLDKQENVAQPPDPWGAWDNPDAHEEANKEFGAQDKAARQAEATENIRVIQDKLNSEPDPDERRALEAALALAKDELRDIGAIQAGPAPHASAVEVVGNEVVVNLPPADEAKQEKRRAFAETIQLEESIEGVSPDDYAKGGPLWLYYGNRDFVKTLPLNAIQVMVADVYEDDPIEAAQMSADLLKYDDVEGPDIVLGRIHGDG